MSWYNRLLSKRMRKKVNLYLILWLFLLIGLTCAILLFYIMDSKTFFKELGNFVTLILLYYTIIDLMLLTTRNLTNTIILPHQIALFPVPRNFIFKYLLFGLVYDVKSLAYISYVILFSYLAILKIGWNIGLIALLLFISFYLCLEIWIVLIYLLFHQLIYKQKKKVNAIPYLILFLTILMNNFDKLQTFFNVPFISWVGKGIDSAKDGHWTFAIFYLSLLTLLAVSGFLLGKMMIKKIEYAY